MLHQPTLQAMEKTIEQKVADAILQKNIASIEIDGVAYNIAPPSIATLIRVSEIISTLPIVEKADGKDPSAIVYSVLRHAKDFGKIGDIAAVLILGARRADEIVTGCRTETKPCFFGLLKRRKKAHFRHSRREELADIILNNVRPSVLWEVIIKRLNMHEIGDFFLITTSLSEANLLKPTREVVQ